MTDVTDDQDDDRLLAELGEAMRAQAEVPPGFVAAGRAAFTWRTVDEDLATLSHRAEHASAGMRSGTDPRVELVFTVDGLTIDVQVTATALQGLLDPPHDGTVELQRPSGQPATAAIEAGWFTFRPPPRGLVRLRVTTASGQVAVTPWTRV